MLGRYNTDELFVGTVSVIKSSDYYASIDGNLLVDILNVEYLTILRKVGDKYYDLSHPKRVLSFEDVYVTDDYCYSLEFVEPLNNYYKNGKKISKKRANEQVLKNYKEHTQKRRSLVKASLK